MSYSTMMTCFSCKKRKTVCPTTGNVLSEGTCTDYQILQDAVTKIHSTGIDNGHEGSGAIVLMCTKNERIDG